MSIQKRVGITIALLIVVISTVSACGGATLVSEPTAVAGVETVAEDQEAAVEPGEDAHWSYQGENGPERWGELDTDYTTCSTGTEQSPIDISGAEQADLSTIDFSYLETAVNIRNNGHTIQVNYDEGSSIEVNGVTYNLEQFHFHMPSEHAVDGELSDAEMHFVHHSTDGEAAVVGLLINSGEENTVLAPVWEHLPAEETPEAETIADVRLNAADILPDGSTYYTYPGSLTTPGCGERVTWLVMTTPIEMSMEQIEQFKAIIGPNNRPLQPLNDRSLLEDNS